MFALIQLESAMSFAIAQARKGRRGANPLVGAVVLDSLGNMLGVGYHGGSGQAHAEIVALADAVTKKNDVTGATLVVSLQPCNSSKVTGPCVEAILEAGISKVVYAVSDPNESGSGGLSALHSAGVEIVSGVCEVEARNLNWRWFLALQQNRPFVSLHIAQTLDSKIAAVDGSSKWITGEQSLADARFFRSKVDAILVGTGTVLVDDPSLTARDVNGNLLSKQPIRVAMGFSEILGTAKICGEDGKFLHLKTHDVFDVLNVLHNKNGVKHLLVEGGATVAGQFLANNLVDEILLYLAPKILGDGVPAVPSLGISSLDGAQNWVWDNVDSGAVTFLGEDIKLRLQTVGGK